MSILTISSLSKVYRKGKVDIPALREVSFEVDDGGFVSIVGRSGSGKSTLLNLIGGLDTATTGHIVFRGRDLTEMKRSRWPGTEDHRWGWSSSPSTLFRIAAPWRTWCWP